MLNDLDPVPIDMNELAERLSSLSAQEMVAALWLGAAPALLKRGLALPFHAASRTLGRTLSQLDEDIGRRGLASAAEGALQRFGVQLRLSGAAVGAGPHLVLANHPGAYDALALMRALSRSDLLILAADRTFLRALPQLSRHLVFVGERAGERAGALKRAVTCLRGGGAVLHFPAGQIEPDADFEPDESRWLEPWQPGLAALITACAKVGGHVLAAGARGVHSPRAKRLALNRFAERRGVTTLSPLLQMLAKLRDVNTRVHCAEALDARTLAALPHEARYEQLRSALRGAIRSAGRQGQDE
jgi:1-acyl-sn-glycerol-3-phosphate acyltransferase